MARATRTPTRTLELYRDLLRRLILPTLGPSELTKLSPSQIRAWHASLRRPDGRGASSAAKAYRLLRAILQTAVADEIILRNPCQVARAGVERAQERPIASVQEVQALADNIHPRYRALILLAAWCGLRRGELFGLRRRDINLPLGTLRVEQNLQQLRDGTLIVGPPKTEAGRRTVAIPPHVIADIAAHLDQFSRADPDALVFAGEKGGPLRPHVLQKEWDRARRHIGRPELHVHDLRHAGNTWAAATGASTRELMARMGHANAQAALRYQHGTADRDRAIAQALSDLAASSSTIPGPDRTRDGRAMTGSG